MKVREEMVAKFEKVSVFIWNESMGNFFSKSESLCVGSEFSHAQGFEQRSVTVAPQSLAETTTQREISPPITYRDGKKKPNTMYVSLSLRVFVQSSPKFQGA